MGDVEFLGFEQTYESLRLRGERDQNPAMLRCVTQEAQRWIAGSVSGIDSQWSGCDNNLNISQSQSKQESKKARSRKRSHKSKKTRHHGLITTPPHLRSPKPHHLSDCARAPGRTSTITNIQLRQADVPHAHKTPNPSLRARKTGTLPPYG